MSDDGDLRELLLRWHAGWVVARDYRSAADGAVVTIDIGIPDRVTETLVLSADPELYAFVARRVADPGHWLTAPTLDWGATEAAAAAAGFALRAPEWLMSCDLAGHPRPGAPDGYETWLSGRPPMAVAEVMTANGWAPAGPPGLGGPPGPGGGPAQAPAPPALAAKGHLALSPSGDDAVADRIFTVPEHRRRGLGSVVMGALTTTARERGARYGLLVASQEGRQLYERLGWRVEAEMASARWSGHTPPALSAEAVV